MRTLQSIGVEPRSVRLLISMVNVPFKQKPQTRISGLPSRTGLCPGDALPCSQPSLLPDQLTTGMLPWNICLNQLQMLPPRRLLELCDLSGACAGSPCGDASAGQRLGNDIEELHACVPGA